MSLISHLLVAFAMALSADAFWRMPCRGITGIARIDPIVSPAEVADHAHIIFGGSNFGKSATSADLVASNCTSTGVLQDKSAYWTPPLYFQFANGTVELVNNVGGMLAYYQLNMDNLTAFPEGFQMVAGNPFVRNFDGPFPDTEKSSWPTTTDPNNQTFLQQRALGFNCLNYNGTYPDEGTMYRHQFPEKSFMDARCLDGLRLEIGFPSCGNGSADSSDHKSHVKYPTLVNEGNCPEGYDVHYPFLMFETIYDTHHYAGIDGQFVLATGDPVGTSYHGDFIMGWDSSDFLQQAVDTCTNGSGNIEDCPLFKLQSDADATQCKFEMPDDLKDDNCEGPSDSLPVNVPIQSGPQMATKYAVAGQDIMPPTSSRPAHAWSTSGAQSLGYSQTFTELSVNTMSPSVPSSPQSQPTHFLGPNKANSISAAGLHKVADPSTTASSTPSSTSEAVIEITTAPAASSPTGKIISTSYITNANEVIEMLIEEVGVTVTATATTTMSAAQHKRHAHHHHARH